MSAAHHRNSHERVKYQAPFPFPVWFEPLWTIQPLGSITWLRRLHDGRRDRQLEMNPRRWTLWAGLLGPPLFVAVFTVEGWLRPGYSARSMFVSELSLGPRGGVQIVNFIVFGLLLLVFTHGVFREWRARRASLVGPVLLAIIGFSLLVSGPLVMDPAATPHSDMTLHSRLHWLFGSFVFSLAPLSCFVFLWSLRRDPAWTSFRGRTLAIGLVTATALIVFSVGPTRPPAPPNAWNEWNGALQRSILIPYALWLFTFALRLRRRS